MVKLNFLSLLLEIHNNRWVYVTCLDKEIATSCLENPMDRGAWWAASRGSQRVGHNWASEHSYITKNNPKYGYSTLVSLLKGPLFSSEYSTLVLFIYLLTPPSKEALNRLNSL